MKHFKLAIFLLIVGILLVVCGNSLLVFKLMDNKKENEEKFVKTVDEKYNLLKKDIESFNKVREQYDTKVSANLFIETIDEYSNWIKEIDSYTKVINKIDKDSKYLKDNCVNKTYTDKETNNKCSAFVIAYESSINLYVNDITEFNKKIEEFKKEIDDEKIVEYDLKYKLTDINKDGKFEGSE